MMERVLRAALTGLSAAALLAFMAVALLRIGHPLPLEPAEGVWLAETARLLHGQPLYAAPSLAYVPLPAMPGFALLAALPATLFGPQLWVLRWIAVLGTLGIAWLVAAVVKRETGSSLFAIAAVGLLFAAVAAGGGRLDLGRPETLAWCLALGGLATLRFTEGTWGALAAALLLALSFFTASHAAWFGLAALVHLALNERPRLAAFAMGLALAVAAGLVGLLHGQGSWFSFYAWDLAIHSLHPDRLRLAAVIGSGLAGTLGPLALSVLLAAALPASLWRGRNGVWVWAAVGGGLAAIVGSAEPDAVSPGLGPAVVTWVIAGPIALVRVVSHLAAWPGSGRPGRSCVLHAVLLIQFLPLAYGLRGQIPDPRAGQAQAVLIEHLRTLRGPVLVPGYDATAQAAGKGSSFDPLALEVLLTARGNGLLARQPALAESLFAPLARGPGRPSLVTGAGIARRYPQVARALSETLARSYQRVAEWRELADSPTPRFVYAPIMETVDAPGVAPAPLAGMIQETPDTAAAR